MKAHETLPLDPSAFQTMTENALDAIMVMNEQGNFAYANRAAHQLFKFDYEQREMLGTCGSDYWLDEDLSLFNQTVMPQTMAGGWSG